MIVNNKVVTKWYMYHLFGGDLSRVKTGEKRWTTLEHNGLIFQKPYEYRGSLVKLKGIPVKLDPIPEEYCYLYARYIETEYVKNKIFNKNFVHDLNKVLPANLKINQIEDIDFRPLYNTLISEKEKKKEVSKEEKEKIKEKKDKLIAPFKICKIDGIETNLGSPYVEPISLFLGRGCNKDTGKVKARVKPSDVTLNLSKGVTVPKCYYLDDDKVELIEIKNDTWGSIIHDDQSVWLASYIDDISGKAKYLWTANDSHIKAESDQAKFDLARELRRRINKIVKLNEEKMRSNNIVDRQLGTALHLINVLAIRVGNESSSDSGVVGCTTLAVENIIFKDNLEIRLDFIGKDSIHYDKSVKVDELVYNNLKEFTNNKSKKDQIFDKISSSDLNKYLNDMMPDLTAKVFRTYNASILMEDELLKLDKKIEGKKLDDNELIDDLLNGFINANLKVSYLCNHQKAVSANFKSGIEKMEQKIKELKKKKKELKEKSIKDKQDKLSELSKKIKKAKAKRDIKLATKNYATSTSLTNYIDPRIVVSWLKRYKIEPDKIYSKALMNKFSWSFNVDENFRF